ncbi:MAG TPA: RluA family pseudouridine synthase [Saprospiraceae bacterium]|nr:RluA family pseudouridine synthase [Saprospiraceae bacterium]HMP25256.1 RluA family pseudouridine synthase [Saprospiraceae bacterium]
MKPIIEPVFEDEALLIVNKPPDLLTIPDRFDATRLNLYGLLSARYEEKLYIVHRLDRETSGIICFAKSEAAHKHLSQQFEARTVEKIYQVLVEGKPNPPAGTIDQPIAPHPTLPGRMTTTRQGKRAITHYQTMETFRAFSLLEANIQTGRTHQIRVHCKFIGHPPAIDPLYGKREALYLSEIKHRNYQLGKEQEERPLMARTTLHAARLTLDHPISGERLHFAAPLPKDFQAVLRQLRKWGN